jgi:hypothetical protein
MPHTAGIASSSDPATSTGVCTPSTIRENAISPIHASAGIHSHQRRTAAAKPPHSSAVFAACPLGNE